MGGGGGVSKLHFYADAREWGQGGSERPLLKEELLNINQDKIGGGGRGLGV